MTVLIDTCVIVDALQNRQPFCKDAQDIFLFAASELFIGCISAKSVTDIYYLTHRLLHSDKETRVILNKLFSLFKIVDTQGADCLHALPSALSDYEDAVMVETANRIEADCIVTRNINDYKNSDVPILLPSELVKRIEAEEADSL